MFLSSSNGIALRFRVANPHAAIASESIVVSQQVACLDEDLRTHFSPATGVLPSFALAFSELCDAWIASIASA